MRIARLKKKLQTSSDISIRIALKNNLKCRGRIKSTSPNPNFKRIRYVRYADDWLIGIWGKEKFAQEVKDRIKIFLEKLKL